MNLTFLKPKIYFKGGRALIMLLLFFIVFSANAQNQNENVSEYLQKLVDNKELNPNDIVDWKITSQHISRTCQVEHIYLRQLYQGKEVNGANASIHFLTDKRLLSSNNQFVKDLKVKGLNTPNLTAIDAVEAVSQQLNYNISPFS